MAKINRFEDIESWKRTRMLTNEIYMITSSGTFSRDFALRDQIRRAAISILSNIAEGSNVEAITSSCSFFRLPRDPVAKLALSFTWHSTKLTSQKLSLKVCRNLLTT